MKNILTPKKCADKLDDLRKSFEDIAVLYDNVHSSDSESCESCNEKTLSMNSYNFLLNIIKSRRKKDIKKVFSIFGDDLLIVSEEYGTSDKNQIISGEHIWEMEKKSFWFSIKTFCNFLIRLFFKSKGSKFYVSKKLRERRAAICRSCPHYNPINKTCSICTCYVKEKVKFEIEECALKEINEEPKW